MADDRFGFGSSSDEALWGPTIDQGNHPPEYVDPYQKQESLWAAGQSRTPIPQIGPDQAAGIAQQVAVQAPDFNWAAALKAGLAGFTAGVGAGRGDHMAGFKVMGAMQQMELQKKQSQQQDEAAKQKKFDKLFDILKDSDADEETLTAFGQSYLKANPELGQLLRDSGLDPANIRLGRKGETVEFKNYKLEGGEFNDPISGKPVEAGDYNLKGKYKNGKFVPISIGRMEGKDVTPTDAKNYTPESISKYQQTKNPSDLVAKESVPDKGDEVYVQAARAVHPNDPVKQAQYIRKLRNNPASWQNQVFNDALERSGGDVTKAASDTIKLLGVAAFERGFEGSTGSERGKLGVHQTPAYLGNRTDIQAADSAGRPLEATTQRDLSMLDSALAQVKNVRDNYNEDFLGPIKGRDDAFAARRSIGSMIRSPVTEQETNFRQSLADISDQLLRARSGAQINEQEYKRLRGMLPKATDEAKVFNAGMDRFEKELKQLMQDKLKYGTTPRGQLGSSNRGSSGGAGLPKILSIEKVGD